MINISDKQAIRQAVELGDVYFIWGTDDVRVRTICEFEIFGYVGTRRFGLKNEDTTRMRGGSAFWGQK